MPSRQTILDELRKLGIAIALVSVLLVLTQDLQLFPGAVSSLFREPPTPPPEFEASLIQTEDGEEIVVWRLGGERKQVALLFHGNAETLRNTAFLQQWFQSHGFTTYAVDYRGYGGSSGWPSERGLSLDAEAAMKHLLERERVTPAEVIVFGNSIGTGPATYIAEKFQVGALVLIAPYTSLKEVLREKLFVGLLAPFLRTNFPNTDRIGALTNTCIIAAHGKKDTTIPHHHSVSLKNLHRGSRPFSLFLSPEAGHNDIFAAAHHQIAAALNECFVTPSLTRTAVPLPDDTNSALDRFSEPLALPR